MHYDEGIRYIVVSMMSHEWLYSTELVHPGGTFSVWIELCHLF